jgi:oligopeptide transport system substrate-binding protein
MNDPALSDFTEPERADIRTALSLLIDRSSICESIAKLGQRPASSAVPAGMTDADGTDFAAHNGLDGMGGGYFSTDAEDYAANCEQAVELLRGVAESSGKFEVSKNGVCRDFPALMLLTSDSAGHVEIANAITASLKAHGIELKTAVLELPDFLEARAKGDYSMARFSWTAAYDDPASFLTLWAAGAGSNCIGLGQGAHGSYDGYTATIGGEKVDGRTWAEAYDALIYTVQGSTDEALRSRCMHEAETLLMQTGAVCPIYEYTAVYLCRDSFKGLFTGPAGALYFMRADASIQEGTTS